MATKAVVHIGEYSRGGKSRGLEQVKAVDHDMRPKKTFVPDGILEVASGTAFRSFSTNGNRSDFPADGLDEWWKERQTAFPYAKRLAVNLDNGPDCSGHRTQFLKRLRSRDVRYEGRLRSRDVRYEGSPANREAD